MSTELKEKKMAYTITQSKNSIARDFLGGPAFKLHASIAGGRDHAFNPWSGNKFPHLIMWPKKNKFYC